MNEEKFKKVNKIKNQKKYQLDENGIFAVKNTLIKVLSSSIFDSCCQVIKISELSNMSPD